MRLKYKTIGIALCALSVFSSCNVLDKEPLDSFTADNFWNNLGNVNVYSNSFYNTFLGYGNRTSFGDFYFKTLSDDQADSEFSDWTQKKNLTNNETWKTSYIEIRRSNILLENIDKVKASETEINHWKGVAKLMRAYHYYHLVRMFGDVPYTDKALEITDTGIIYGKRTNRDEVMKNVLDDLDYACKNIKDVGSKIAWSRSLANAIKSEICLYEGTFRKYRKAEDGQPSADVKGAEKYLDECQKSCVFLMNKSYTLNESYQGNYNSVSLINNPEMIFIKQYRDGVLAHSLIDYICSSTQINGMTKDAFDAYLFVDGRPLSLTKCDRDLIPKMVNGKLSLEHMLNIRDKRLSQTIDNVLLYEGNENKRFPKDMSQHSSTGYGIQKYDNGTIDNIKRSTQNQNFTDAPLYWLSVIYLNYAEAKAELNTITQEDLDKSINLLRKRAGLPSLSVNVGFSDPANNIGVSDLIWEIRRERRCELMFDNWFRYWDLVRWHQLDKLDSTKYPNILLGGNVTNDPTFKAQKNVDNWIDGSKGKVRTFDKKYYLYPIPSSQIDLNNNLLPNNPGW